MRWWPVAIDGVVGRGHKVMKPEVRTGNGRYRVRRLAAFRANRSIHDAQVNHAQPVEGIQAYSERLSTLGSEICVGYH